MKRIFILIGAALILLYSCRKSFLDYEGSDSDEFSIKNVKAHYESLQVGNSIGNNIKSSKSHYVPYWPKAYKAKYGNSEFVEVPLISYKKKIAMYDFAQDSVKLKPDKSVRNASFQRMIFFLDKDKQIQQHIVTYLPDKGYLQKHKFDASHNQFNKMDNDFSGYLEYTGLNGNFIKVLRVMNGKVKGTYTLSPKRTLNDKKKGVSTSAWVCYQGNCEPTYDMSCVHDPAFPDNPYASICTETYTGDNCEAQYCYESGSGGGSDGGGGGSPGPDPTDPIYGPDAPCNEKNVIQSRASNTEIQNNNDESRTLTVASVNNEQPKEYGAEQNLVSLTSSNYKNTTVRTDNLVNKFTSTFTWNSTDGYTIGVTHGHPGKTAPSPADVFWIIHRTGYNSVLHSAGPDAVQFFKDNASVTVVTENVSYVVTIRDWAAFEILYYDGTATDENYNLKTEEFLINNPNESLSTATAYALLSLFGSTINLYHAGAGSTYFMPINVYNGGVSNTPCP